MSKMNNIEKTLNDLTIIWFDGDESLKVYLFFISFISSFYEIKV